MASRHGTGCDNVQSVFDQGGRRLNRKAERQMRGLAKHPIGYIEYAVCPRLTLVSVPLGPAVAQKLSTAIPP